MKKFLFLFLVWSTIVPSILYAQRLTQQQHIPLTTDSLIGYKLPYVAVSDSGKNRIWNFSGLSTDSAEIVEVNYYASSTDTMHIGLHREHANFYYHFTQDTLWQTGYETSHTRVQYLIPTLHFPFVYGDSIIGEVTGNGEYCHLLPIHTTGSYMACADAAGKLLLPDMTVDSVLRLHTTMRYHEDSPLFTLDSIFSSPYVIPNGHVIYQHDVVLANHGDTITLYNAAHEIVDQIYYDGTSHLSKPDRLSANNEDSISGNQCVSLHRTWVEFDEDGRVVPGTSQWKTDLVSFDTCQLAETTFFEHYLVNPSSPQMGDNYILSVSPLDPTTRVSVSDNGISVSSGIRTQTAIQYYDGLGRPVETLALGATPGKHDLVQVTEYSGLHRATQHWSPIPAETEGQFMNVSDFQSQAQSYYLGDERPFIETLYENSALNRVVGQKRQGDSWINNPTSNSYLINGETDNVRIYTIIHDSILKTTGENYAEYTLYKTISADEDEKSVTTYTDKLGRTIAEERAGNRVYYVYDDLGRLRYVLPHISPSKLATGEYAPSDTTLRAAAYYYKYDLRGNVIVKRLPGCEQQYMVYDQIGQLILTQDGNQRLANKWTLHTYDSIGRNLYTAEASLPEDHNYYINRFANQWYAEHYGNNPSNTSIPRTGYASSIIPKGDLQLLTVNYYDDYHYLTRLDTPVRQKLRFAQESGYGLQHDNATGMLTGTRVYSLSEKGEYTATSYYYDMNGRIVQSRSVRTTDDYQTATSTEYLFDGSVAQQLMTQGTDSDLVSEHYRYTYDHAGRAKSVRYQLNNDDEITLSSFSYDSIGRLAQNLLHNNRDTITYTYDMRNMLTETKNGHFSEKLYYADIPSNEIPNAIKCYNGNIAVTCAGSEEYGFHTFWNTYDEQNRLISSYSYSGSSGEHFSYDNAGNIISLRRQYSSNRYDDLTFHYGNDGHQLLSVTDEGYDADYYDYIEYIDLNKNGEDMSYDANGNLVRDLDRDISIIKYNILNLPDTIQFINGHQIVNLYDARGRKYKSIIYTNICPATTYHNEIAHYTFDIDTVNYRIVEYNDNVIQITQKEYNVTLSEQTIYNATGYFRNGVFYHYIKDHIGNNCAVVNSVTNEVVQNVIYFASGVPIPVPDNIEEQPYLYNGKEFVEAHGLNEYDSQARMYYAPIMRTTTMDPLAEEYYHISPYAWCGNNPIGFVDPEGMAWKPTYTFDENGHSVPNGFEWVEEAKSYDNNGELLPGLYNQAIFFSENGTFSPISTWNIGSSTATIYLSDGSSKDYAACTYPSDVEKFPTIPEGEYEAYVGMHNQKYLALKMRDIGAQMQTIQLGFVNPAYDDGRTYAIGVDIHKAGRDNFTGIGRDLNAVSEACFLIDIHSWDNFMSHFTSQPIGTIIGIQASRSYSKPINANIYPVFNFIYNYYRKSYLHPLMMK